LGRRRKDDPSALSADSVVAKQLRGELLDEGGELALRLLTYFRETGAPHRALEDGRAIVVRDGVIDTVDCHSQF